MRVFDVKTETFREVRSLSDIVPRVNRDWRYIVIHHSATKDNPNFFDSLQIRQYHIKEKGWREIGYHYLIENREGYVYVLGRSLTESGAHAGITYRNVKNYVFNTQGIGICLVGNFDIQTPTQEQLDLLRELVRLLMRVYKIQRADVLGHWEVFIRTGVVNTKNEAWSLFKTCPGRNFDLISFRNSL